MRWPRRFTSAKNQNLLSGELAGKIGRWTWRHLELVGASLLLAIVAGIPLGIRASRPGPVSDFILSASGMIQTIPSLALLALLVPIPFFGISPVTAIFALFLYSLLADRSEHRHRSAGYPNGGPGIGCRPGIRAAGTALESFFAARFAHDSGRGKNQRDYKRWHRHTGRTHRCWRIGRANHQRAQSQ